MTSCGVSNPERGPIFVQNEGIVCFSRDQLGYNGIHITISPGCRFSRVVKTRSKQAKIDIHEDRIVLSSSFTLIPPPPGPVPADCAGGGLIQFEILPGDLEPREYPIVLGEKVIGVIAAPVPDPFYQCFDTTQLDENLPILSPLYVESPLVLPTD